MVKKIVPAKNVPTKYSELTKKELVDVLDGLLPQLRRELDGPNKPGPWVKFDLGGRPIHSKAISALLALATALVEKEKGKPRGVKSRHGDKTAIATAALVLRQRHYPTQAEANRQTARIVGLPVATVEDYRKERKHDAQKHAQTLTEHPEQWDLPDDPAEAVKHILTIIHGKRITLAYTSE